MLCEKPFALNETEARLMVDAARTRGLFLMEAIWSRFLPSYQLLGRLLADQVIGEPLLVEGDFGFRRPIDPAHRLFDPALGGGALLDLGIYPVQLASLVLGAPDAISAQAHVGETGVDEQVAALLHHPSGALAVVKAAIRVSMACTARIAGTDGVIDLPAFMHCPDHLVVTTGAGRRASRRADRGRGSAVRGDGGAALRPRGPHREPVAPPRRDLHPHPHPRHHPRADRRGLPRARATPG